MAIDLFHPPGHGHCFHLAGKDPENQHGMNLPITIGAAIRQ
ncbi:hypothetical protein ACX0G9_02555 [Flavitalea flava]